MSALRAHKYNQAVVISNKCLTPQSPPGRPTLNGGRKRIVAASYVVFPGPKTQSPKGEVKDIERPNAKEENHIIQHIGQKYRVPKKRFGKVGKLDPFVVLPYKGVFFLTPVAPVGRSIRLLRPPKLPESGTTIGGRNEEEPVLGWAVPC